MILLKNLKLKDFYSHENTEIHFNESTKLLLNGESGAGKSAILEGIIFALYGEARTDNKSVVRNGAKKSSVTLTLSNENKTNGVDANVIEIERSITSQGKHTLEIRLDGIAHPLTGVRELQNWIEKELICASYLLFVNSIAYMQGNSESFVSQNAARRKDILLEIIKAENYDIYYDKAKKKLDELNLKKISLESEISRLSYKIEKDTIEVNKETDIQKELSDLQIEIKADESKRDELLTFIAKYDEAEKNIKLCENRVSSLDKEVKRAEEAVKSLTERINSINALPFNLDDYNALQVKIEGNNASLKDLENTLSKLMESVSIRNAYMLTKPHIVDMSSSIDSLKKQIEDFSGKMECPSGENCPHQKNVVKSIESNKTQISLLEKTQRDSFIALQTWQDGLKNLPHERDTSAIVHSISTLRDIIKSDSATLTNMQSIKMQRDNVDIFKNQLPVAITEMETKTTEYLSALNEREEMKKNFNLEGLQDKKIELNTIDTKLNWSRMKLSKNNADLINIEQMKNSIIEDNINIANIKNNILPVVHEDYDNVSIIKDAFGSKGIKSVVIDFILPQLEEKINAVLSKLSDFSVRLDTQQLKADGEGNKEGLFITIINELGNEMPWENYSGGERLKITVAISEALASLQKVGFRLMDETFIGLDSQSTENFSMVLEKLQSSFNQVLMISHLVEIKDMFENKINIIKRNGISIIE